MSNTVKTFAQWCDENPPLNSEERPAAEGAWEAGQQAMREQFPYQLNRNQLKGILMMAYGPIIPARVAKEYADRVLDLLDTNEEVQCLIQSMEKMEGGKP